MLMETRFASDSATEATCLGEDRPALPDGEPASSVPNPVAPQPPAAPQPEAGSPRAEPEDAARSRSWVPIRSLGPRHRERILTHLQALDEHSRYLRFGYAATDAQMSKYVDRLDFERDEVFGIFNRRL